MSDAARGEGPNPEFVVRSVLVGAMTGALIAALAAIGTILVPGWRPGFLIAYCVVVAIAAQWTHWFLTNRLPQSFDRHWFRAVELGALVALGLLGDALLGGRPGGLGALTTLDLRTLIMALLILAAWGASTTTASEFARLGEPPERDPTYVPPLEGLTRRFFLGGALLLAAIGLTRVDPRRLLDATRGSIGGPIVSALLFFVLGLTLLALAQHQLLGRRWREDGVAVAAGLGGRWARLSLALMAIAMLVAFVLPTAYGIGLLDLLAIIVQALIYLFTALGFGVLAPLAWLLSLLIPGGQATPPPAAPAAQPPPPPPPPTDSGINWVDVIRWTIFGILALVLAGWLLRGWLENRGLLGSGLSGARPLARLRAFLAALLRRLRGLVAEVAARLPTPRARGVGRAKGQARGGMRLPGARTPREQVVRYYLSLARRAASHGLGRRPAQTPQEYAASLRAHVQPAQQDLADLTDAFTEARYSRHDVSPEGSRHARGNWERLRDALRARERARAAGDAETPHTPS